jgi:CRISPR-associated endonuclease/helicase Cas3
MNHEKFYAHSLEDQPPENWQLLKDHLIKTAQFACEFATCFKADNWAYIAGLWHDAGKYSDEFQKMLKESADVHIEHKSKIDHSTFGAQQAAQKWPKGEGKLLAYIIAGHHTGIPDGKANNDSSLTKRLDEKKLRYSFHCPEDLFDCSKPQLPFTPEIKRAGFKISFLIRMLYSCLVDADFLDTEKHMAPHKFAMRPEAYSLLKLQKRLDRYLRNLLRSAANTSVNQIRAQILQNCLQAADQEPGLFSLTVPTGGGKTLSSMSFALKHAIAWKQKRIIYVIPYTSIIEQNAAVFRSVFGDDKVLEHHSNYEPEEEDHRTRLASENWDAPIVVTTNVQFFESLFACRSSRCRKLHNIAQCTIILDETQALPSEMLLPCIEALRELVLHYNCSIVLCSATQPAIQQRKDFGAGLQGVREIVNDPVSLSQSLKRITTHDLGVQSDSALITRLKRHDKVLCVVNTRRHARILYQQLSDEENVFHLSASLCPLDRSRILGRIREVLWYKKRCRVVSTQLVEAGVDLDFPVVYRAIAGIDSIAQAAGRCNREGLLDRGEVFVFWPEHMLPPGYFRQAAQAAESVMRRFPEDILSLDAIEEYFRDYYWSQGDRLDKDRILKLVAEGTCKLNFPFREIAHKFRLIEDNSLPVIVERDEEATRLIEEIRHAHSLRGYNRKLQKYTVQICQYDWNKLFEAGCIEKVRDIFPLLVCSHLYDENIGLDISKLDNPDPSDLIG